MGSSFVLFDVSMEIALGQFRSGESGYTQKRPYPWVKGPVLVLNPAAGVSFSIINKLINHMAFIESRHFVIVFILLLLDLISSRLVS